VYHLNDSEEYLRANRLLREEIAKRLKDSATLKLPFSEWLETIGDDDLREKEDVFIASFSEKADLLSQWRAYTRCDDAYSIGFTADELKPAISVSAGQLVKCVYQQEEQKLLLSNFLDYIYKHVQRNEKLHGPKVCGWMERMYSATIRILAAIKNPSFEEEQEWRIIVGNDTRNTCFRSGRFGVVPFYKLPLATDEQNRLRFSDVVIGPTSDRKAAEYAVGQLIRHNKSISHSQSSLRA
jgi:hypothetical protein